MSEFLIYEQTGHVVSLTMNRPDSRNALSDNDQFQEFVDVCSRINRDMSVRAVVLTGNGKSFCAGGDIKHMRHAAEHGEGPPFKIRNRYKYGIQQIPLAVYHLEVPTIAAVNGAAIGAGCDLACMCDVRIASEYAKFAESFVKLGIIPGDGGSWLLPRAVGLSNAYMMTFTGDTLDAEQSLAMGLVSKVVPADDLLNEATELANRMAANPPHALRLAKQMLREGQHMRLETMLEMASSFQAISHFAADHKEALTAFMDKRQPEFKGE